AFHVEVILRAGHRVALAGFLHVFAGGGPESVGSTHNVRVETFVRAGVASFRAAVAERQYDDAVGLTGNNPNRCGYFALRKRNIDFVRNNLAVLATARSYRVFEVEIIFGLGADISGIVPSELRDRLRQFLEPAVVGEAAVVDAGIRAEDEFVFACGYSFRRSQAGNVHLSAQTGQRRIGSVCDESIVKSLAPEFLEGDVVARL